MTSSLNLHPLQPRQFADALHALRERAPLVQCLTNIVVANFSANVLLAAGCAPAMVDNAREAEGFAAISAGVLVNLGTPYEETAQAMRAAVRGAHGARVPWVLDPVAAGALPWRTEIALELLEQHRPTIVRGNGSEILALAGGQGGKGVESTAGADQAVDAAVMLARRHACVVAVSGAIDQITDGERLVRIANGHPQLTRVTGAGCALGALMAAFAGVTDDALLAAAAATALLTVAADAAAQVSRGPGSFAVALIDELHALTPEALAARLKLA
ncbi:hydroxyethylthiazole kinase [Comamonas sp. NLF-1-9]|uniref:hydroxyethylthiazole kinase n=1 Tax=Comamonas sp. NLF-1-9 TaxID=2853163 RepID=UPI001C45F71A|nr:hydroxyethylthiazole kinase [Comamonas sp. NLF-1-9]QXL84081.1 hydroxyethylthiazole kinase [Comamonas sp. NLF-1-9]